MEFGLYPAEANGRTKIYAFGGLNRTRHGNRYEFSDMYNMSADEYPCAAPCGSRVKIADAQTGINAVCAPDATNTEAVTGITGVCDGGFYYNGELKSDKFTLSSEWSWQIEQKGNVYIINGYDKSNKKSLIYYYNIDTDEFGEGGKVMRNLIVQSGTNYLCTPNMDAYGMDTYVVTLPDGTLIKNSDFWLDYKDYTTYDTSANTTMSSTENIFEQYFEVGDEITIERFPGTDNGGQIWNIQSSAVYPQPGITADRNNTVDTDNMTTTASIDKNRICTARITSFGIKTASGGRASHYVYFELLNKNGEAVEFRDMYTGGYYCSGVTLKKRTRTLDNITVHHGRIWGSAPSGNQIYASASDDIFSFSADDVINRYGVRIPSDTPGTFSALCSFNNDLIAFKNDSVTVISGTNPVNYNATVIGGIGCISPKSVAVTPNGVIFLSYNGFYIYDGSMPQCISSRVNTAYISAVAGYDGNSYYACATRADGVRELLVYDMRYGLWHKRDDIAAVGFFRFLDGFYIADDTKLYKADSAAPGDWSFTLMRTHENNFDNKGVNEIRIRAEVSQGSMFMVETAVGNGEFETHKIFTEPGLNIYLCPVRLRMGSSYQVRVCGSGNVVIYELEIRKSDGGRRYKEY